MKILYVFGILLTIFNSIQGECDEGCGDLPISVYKHLNCTPKYTHPNDCCPKEYDCSNVFQRPEGTCHFRGKFYKPGEVLPDSEKSTDGCLTHCKCTENLEFKCYPPNTPCHEHYLPDYPKQSCLLQYQLNSCCATGQLCPPFDLVPECIVHGNVYKEGQRFPHPHEKCTRCVCQRDSNNLPEFNCQLKPCSTEISYSKDIDNYCAPFYIHGSCCPSWWICPKEDGVYLPSPEREGTKCRFGEKLMDVGSKYLYQGKHTAKIVCNCVVPPFLSCTEQAGE